ncbi:MAG: elongation factor Ts, partial [Acholeplasmataceae bacterium]|nr:elongation factor Ts [Acholeplasmataceae bacterium]
MDISKIKALREETGLGMLEVKKALSEANDDLEKAREILSSQTIKKADTTRVASKGLTRITTKGNEAILFEVNAETDFVAKHKDFIQLLDD